jgi:hypothetical protein
MCLRSVQLHRRLQLRLVLHLSAHRGLGPGLRLRQRLCLRAQSRLPNCLRLRVLVLGLLRLWRPSGVLWRLHLQLRAGKAQHGWIRELHLGMSEHLRSRDTRRRRLLGESLQVAAGSRPGALHPWRLHGAAVCLLLLLMLVQQGELSLL